MQVTPKGWQKGGATPTSADLTTEFFSDARIQTLVLVGPEVDHTRWVDHNGGVHVEDWDNECLLLWIVPAGYKPTFPKLIDRIAGERLPHCIFASKQVVVYGYARSIGTKLLEKQRKSR